jgi:hypothetical protein
MEFITIKQIKDIKIFKQSIYDGKVFILKKNIQIIDLNNYVLRKFKSFFKIDVDNFINNDKAKKINEVSLVRFQKNIKESKILLKKFAVFLENLKFNINEILSDKITFRYSPKNNSKALGLLKPVKAHRDTWASNMFHQINWWIPLQNVKENNSIYLIPKYFNKKVKNTSNEWSFEKYKLSKNYPSTPFSNIKFRKSDIKSMDLEFGDVLIFSGNHIHGSLLSNTKRLNLETRTISEQDEYKFKIPKNIDSFTKVKKKAWFSCLKKEI